MTKHWHRLKITEEHVVDLSTSRDLLVYAEADLEIRTPGVLAAFADPQSLAKVAPYRSYSVSADAGGVAFDLTVRLTDEERGAYLALRERILARVLAALGIAEGE